MDESYIEFRLADDERFDKLLTVFNVLRDEKQSEFSRR